MKSIRTDLKNAKAELNELTDQYQKAQKKADFFGNFTGHWQVNLIYILVSCILTAGIGCYLYLVYLPPLFDQAILRTIVTAVIVLVIILVLVLLYELVCSWILTSLVGRKSMYKKAASLKKDLKQKQEQVAKLQKQMDADKR